MEARSFSGIGCAVDPSGWVGVHEQFDAAAAQLQMRDGDAGQRWPQPRGKIGVVEGKTSPGRYPPAGGPNPQAVIPWTSCLNDAVVHDTPARAATSDNVTRARVTGCARSGAPPGAW